MRRLLRLLPILLPLAWFVHAGLEGVDFQKHWDERQMVLVVRESIAEGRHVPGWYHYPSMCFSLGRAALWPLVWDGAPPERRVAETTKWRYRLRVRSIFLGVSALALLWVYLALLAARRPVSEALLAAGVLAGSYEWAYHARWFAPDAVMAQFGALSLLGVVLAEVRGWRSGVLLAALAAGLACATKYTGGAFLLPALVVAWRSARAAGRSGLRDLVAVAVVFGTAFLVVTPGALVDTGRFLADLRFEMTHYREMGHYGHTVEPGLDLAGRIGRYLACDIAAPHTPAAALVAVLALVGLVAAARRRPALAALLVAGPLLLVVTMTTQRVLFVRNLLPVLPVMAMLAAWGVGSLAARAGERRAPWIVLLAGALLLAPGLVHNHRAAASIRDHEELGPARDLAAWLTTHSDRTVEARPFVAEQLRALGVAPENLVAPGAGETDLVAFTIEDHPAAGSLPSNVPGSTVAWFGPRDVNLEYYTAWLEPWIFLVDRRTAEAWHVFDPPRND